MTKVRTRRRVTARAVRARRRRPWLYIESRIGHPLRRLGPRAVETAEISTRLDTTSYPRRVLVEDVLLILNGKGRVPPELYRIFRGRMPRRFMLSVPTEPGRRVRYSGRVLMLSLNGETWTGAFGIRQHTWVAEFSVVGKMMRHG